MPSAALRSLALLLPLAFVSAGVSPAAEGDKDGEAGKPAESKESGEDLQAKWQQRVDAWRQLRNRSKLKEAFALAEEMRKDSETLIPKDQMRFQVYYLLSLIRQDEGNWAEGIAYLEKGIALGEKIAGPDHVEVASMQQSLAVCYRHLGKLDEAEKYFKLSQKALEAQRPAGDYLVVRGLFYYARLHLDRAQYDEAEKLYLRVVDLQKKMNPVPHGALANTLNNLGGLYRLSGRPAQAMPCYREALEEIEKEEDPDVSMKPIILENLARVAMMLGDREAAYKGYREALALMQSLNLPGSGTAMTRASLGYLCLQDGQYDEAKRLFDGAYEDTEKSLGPDHPYTLMMVQDKARLLKAMGQSALARPLLERVLKGYEARLGPSHPDLTEILTDLSSLDVEEKRFDEGMALLQRTEKILKSSTPVNPLRLCAVYGLMGSLESARKNYAEAERFYQSSIEMTENLLGTEHPDLINTLADLAKTFEARGDYAKAEAIYLRSQKLCERYRGPLDPFTVYHHGYLGLLRMHTATLPRAFEEFQRGADGLMEVQLLPESVAPFRKRLAMLEEGLWLWHIYFSTGLEILHENPGQAVPLARTILNYQGTVFERRRRADRLAKGAADPALKELLAKLEVSRQALSKRLWEGPGKQAPVVYAREVKELETQHDLAEMELFRKNKGLERELGMKPLTVEQVQKALPDDAALVCFVYSLKMDFKAVRGTGKRFFALVCRKDLPPKIVDLGDAPPIQDLSHRFYAQAQKPGPEGEKAAQELSDRIFKPLWPYLKDKPRWLVSPDEILSLVPLALLPSPGGAPGRLVLDDVELTYLSSGRDLLAFADRGRADGEVVVLGDPDFDLDLPAGEQGATRALLPLQTRWPKLPATREEAQAVAAEFKAKSAKVRMLLGAEASKIALLGIAHPRVLHLATHGFCLQDQALMPPAEAFGRGLAGITTAQPPAPGTPPAVRSLEDPMVRSGLVLAGANKGKGAGDGYLTAQDILDLDLSGTDLVTLSACETGQGAALTGQGVMGLRRSILQAGAKTLITSLWKVPDRETKDLMIDFYRRLLAGTRKGKALREAMLSERDKIAKEKGAAPLHLWGAFILVGNPD